MIVHVSNKLVFGATQDINSSYYANPLNPNL
jgi:hypothetical protein